MNFTVAKIGAVITALSVIGFAICMLIEFDFGSYLVSMFIAFGFVMMIAGFHAESDNEHKVAANTALVLSGVYTVLILLVYFAQTTAVRLDSLGEEALRIIDYKRLGLFFSYDLLGYGVMSLATFFIGLSINARSRLDKWLKWLLMFHGVFFIGCFLAPMLGMFSSKMDGADWIGMLILEVWCIYFLPICILSYLHFANTSNK
ncbi:hypothetical protein JT739_10605 [Tepidanaerobacter sp. GT38]|uniref:hypothetical protein n=1 Tax=Tepidanaerobacter sp. GT38 TaxID=2722793 RepID=UPI001F33CE39|nr:hypothetical protein [Tepidanaerobacter sp. GT38]MCG1013042.1 hypothetical protein [Tepidanaerobacter sp. GT38]